MTAYYNEIDPYAAQWLRNLIKAGHIAAGDVDERSIVDVTADDLRGYTQAHFFAGIGGWSIALRLAGWPDDRPVWTGSCPCQPFSAAGTGKAGDDERHLWPAWFPLIAQCGPPVVFGEQVEAAVGWGWLDAVFADLEGEGYACGATILPACGVGAPHIRNRLWFVADAGRGTGATGQPGAGGETESGRQENHHSTERGRQPSSMADADGRDASTEGLQRGGEQRQQPQGGGADELGHAAGRGQREFGDATQPRRGRHANGAGEPSSMGDTGSAGRERRIGPGDMEMRGGARTVRPASEASVFSFWADAEWIACTDGKSRPVGPGSFPLGHGIQRRPSKLRAYGNAIVPQVAAEFIRAAIC